MNVGLSKFPGGWLLGAFTLGGLALQAAPVTISVESPSRLQTLERKAQESDRYRTQCYELQKTMDEMMALLPGDKTQGTPADKPGLGQLSRLLEKAALADVLVRELDEAKSQVKNLTSHRDALLVELAALHAEQLETAESLEKTKTDGEKWESKVAGLRETIERLLLGEFEYYEVKEGDSLQSIASSPMIYGTPERATWLRQANEGRVKRIEHLREGEMLIIPRFPRNGSYEF